MGNKIEQVYVTKFLGVLIDNKLSWNPQITNVKSKLSKCTAVLFKAKFLVDINTIMSLYNSLFLPYISYCVEIRANTYITKLKPLNTMQKRAIRIISNVSKYTHTNELFKVLKILKFIELVEFRTCIVMFNAYHSKLPKKLQTFFSIGDNLCYKTRQSNKFKVKYKRTNVKAFCVSSKGPKLWNSLPNSATETKSINIFKIKLKKILLMRY